MRGASEPELPAEEAVCIAVSRHFFISRFIATPNPQALARLRREFAAASAKSEAPLACISLGDDRSEVVRDKATREILIRTAVELMRRSTHLYLVFEGSSARVQLKRTVYRSIAVTARATGGALGLDLGKLASRVTIHDSQDSLAAEACRRSGLSHSEVLEEFAESGLIGR